LFHLPFFEPLRSQLNVLPRGLPGLFLEGVQYQHTYLGSVARKITRKAPSGNLTRISWTPGPTAFMGFQSVGSLPFCTSRSS